MTNAMDKELCITVTGQSHTRDSGEMGFPMETDFRMISKEIGLRGSLWRDLTPTFLSDLYFYPHLLFLFKASALIKYLKKRKQVDKTKKTQVNLKYLFYAQSILNVNFLGNYCLSYKNG